jgi:hypothetical protein
LAKVLQRLEKNGSGLEHSRKYEHGYIVEEDWRDIAIGGYNDIIPWPGSNAHRMAEGALGSVSQ